MVRSLFGNSNRKLRSTFRGSPFIPVGKNQTEFCLPLTNFSVPSRFQTHATQIRPFFGFKPWNFYCNVKSLPLCFWHPNCIFLSNGRHPSTLTSLPKFATGSTLVRALHGGVFVIVVVIAWDDVMCQIYFLPTTSGHFSHFSRTFFFKRFLASYLITKQMLTSTVNYGLKKF